MYFNHFKAILQYTLKNFFSENIFLVEKSVL